MPAIASLQDLKTTQKEDFGIYAMPYASCSMLSDGHGFEYAMPYAPCAMLFEKWRRIGWKNICKLWLKESTPERLKGEER